MSASVEAAAADTLATTGLSGKVAVVTGAAHGLGAASASRLARAGARLVIVDTDADAAAALAAALPTDAISVAGDVSQEETVSAYVDAALAQFGTIDLHHLNAGISGSHDRFPDLTVADFDRVMGVNVRGAFLGLRAAFQVFESQAKHGAIVLTASIASLRGSADLIAYQTSKHAVLGLLEGAATYGGPLNIRVNAVAPGIVPTELFAAAAGRVGGRDDMTARAMTTPLRRPGSPDEIAAVVEFLLSDNASYVTGEYVRADGGAASVSIVRPSGGAGAWDYQALDADTYPQHTHD